MGDVRVVNGEKQIYILGFGWIEYSGKPSVGIVAEDMYENDHKIGSMGDCESPPREAAPPQTSIEQSEPTGNEINTLFVEVPKKNSTPPPYKPDTTSP